MKQPALIHESTILNDAVGFSSLIEFFNAENNAVHLLYWMVFAPVQYLFIGLIMGLSSIPQYRLSGIPRIYSFPYSLV